MPDTLFHHFLESSFDWEYWQAADGSLLAMNSRAEEITGYPPAEFQADPSLLARIVHPEDRAAYEAHVAKVESDPHSRDLLTFRIVTRSGEVRHIEHGCRPVFDESGQCLGHRVSNRDVTARFKSESELLRARAWLEETERVASLGHWTLDLATNALEWSDETCRMFGVEPGTPMNVEKFAAIVHPSDVRRVLDGFYKALGEGAVYECEHRIIVNGAVRWVRERADTSCPTDGKIVGTVLDITALKSAFLEIQKERDLFKAGPVCVIEWGLEEGWPVHQATSNVKDLLGLSVSELTKPGFLFASLIHPEDLPRVAEECGANIRGGAATSQHQYRVRMKDGGWRWVREFTHIIRDENGRAEALRGYLYDDTERRESEQALRLFKRALEQSPSVILITDPNGVILHVNKKFSEVTGYSPAEALGRKTSNLRSPLEPAETFRSMWASLKEGREWRGELRNRRKDGGDYWAAVSISPVIGPGGETTHFVSVQEDITSQKEAEQELVRLNHMLQENMLQTRELAEKAEAANRAKSEFLANISHEIRTPMNGILGVSGLLMDSPMPREQRELVAIIRDSAESLLEIINDVLDFSKIEAGRMTLDPRPFDLRELVRGVGRAMSPAFAGKGLEWVAWLDPRLPSGVVADPVRLRQILNNLLSNALKFTDKGWVELNVFPMGEPREGAARIRFEVQDTGPGIPLDKQVGLFTRFSQVDSSPARRHGGTGLGLAICKHLVEMMGGTIGLESGEGSGAKFFFEIPVPVLAGHPEKAPPSQPALSRKKILVAGCVPPLAKVLSRWLGARGAEVRVSDPACADSRADTPPAPHKPEFDLVIVDYSLLEDWRREGIRPPAAKVLALLPPMADTAVADACRVADAVLRKPLLEENLFAAMESCLDPGGSHPSEPETPAQTSRAPEFARSARVLIVEDHHVNRMVAVRLLGRLGIEALEAPGGPEALETLRNHPVDLVLMDVQMPGMDGLETTRRLRELEQSGALPRTTRERLPVVALTAHAMSGDRELCLAAGMDDYLSKPIRIEELRETLKKWLGPEATSSDPSSTIQI